MLFRSHDSLRAGYPIFDTTSTDDKYTGFHISDLNTAMDAPLVRQIGCVIGTHTGPGAFGIAFFDKELVLE